MHACQKAGIETVPALIDTLDRDAAAIDPVDSNLHREKILPSEKAYAYKLKMDAMSRQEPGTGNQPIPGEVLYFAGSENRQSIIPIVNY